MSLSKCRQDSSQDGDANGVEWEEYEIQQLHQQPEAAKQPSSREQPDAHKSSYKSLEVGASRPSPGSVGKLRISNEMKHKLEMVTANHSLRSSTGKPRPQAMNNMPTAAPAGKLDTDRRLLLQQQLGECPLLLLLFSKDWLGRPTRREGDRFLASGGKKTRSMMFRRIRFSAGRWGSADSVDSPHGVAKEDGSDVNNVIRSQVDRIESSGWRLPPPPITPSRSNSFYSPNNM